MNPYIVGGLTLNANGDRRDPTYDDLSEELRAQINEHTASKFVVEQLNPRKSDSAHRKISVPRFNRFEFELKPRQRHSKGEFTPDYAVAGSPEFSVTYSLVLDPAYRESVVYKNMNEQVKREFDAKEAQLTKIDTQHWLGINNVCVESETVLGVVQLKRFRFFRNEEEVFGDNPKLTYRSRGDNIDDKIIEQVRELLLSKFQIKLLFVNKLGG
jgi:hypothetical protein